MTIKRILLAVDRSPRADVVASLVADTARGAHATVRLLHVAPESFAGGPLALVRDGDMIELDVEARRLQLHVDDAEIARRRAAWKPPAEKFTRGYGRLFSEHVTQAHLGCDFDFLTGRDPSEPAIH